MSLLLKKYTVTGRYDKSLRKEKIFGLCGNCGIGAFAITCNIRNKSSRQTIPLGMKYCASFKTITIIDEKLKIVKKNGTELL
jgi:hypothetical protein